ncbi:MAG: HIT domain-containing protein [Deltaproteobacteria bacterium]|nr:HIT domain-containing protein [Deltaproteobacteria bacterium]
MNRLWAPWRMDYISGGVPEGCIFCNAPGAPPGSSLLLFSGHLSMVMMNRYPYNNGHLMVAPRRHGAEMDGLGAEESMDVLRLINRCVAVLKDVFKPGGFNIGLNLGRAAGAGIEDHIHWHVVPRWDGDTNFMPVVADVKVMPEHLMETVKKLRPHFDKP